MGCRALEGRGNGRIIRYDPATGVTRTVIRNLLFANGVCMAHDNKSLLFAETWGCRISRYWLEGPKQGTTEILSPTCPAIPTTSTGDRVEPIGWGSRARARRVTTWR